MALARKYRLIGKKEFELTKKQGKLVQTPLFALLINQSNQLEEPKFGFIVSKKIDRRAIIRHRLKRILSEAVRRILPEIRKDLKVIILAKPALKQADLNQVLNLMRKKFGEFAEKK